MIGEGSNQKFFPEEPDRKIDFKVVYFLKNSIFTEFFSFVNIPFLSVFLCVFLGNCGVDRSCGEIYLKNLLDHKGLDPKT